MESIVITGATGMIGTALIKTALTRQVSVLALAKPGIEISHLPVSRQLKIVECDMSEYQPYNDDHQYDVFFHLAWAKTFGSMRNDVYSQIDNIRYTLDAVHLAHRLGCKTFVGVGSQAEYGSVSDVIASTTPVNPQSGYGIAKYAAGSMSALLCAQLGIRHSWARVLSVYGPNDGAQTLIMYCIETLLNGRKPSLTNCDQIWDYLYCDDAARALLAIGERGKDKGIYCVGSGDGKPLKNYVETIRDMIDIGLPLGFGEKPYYEDQQMYLCADISNLTADTGFVPRINFQDGIRETIKWYREGVPHE